MRLTRNNGPIVSLLSTYRRELGLRPKAAGERDREKRPASPGTDDDPLSSSDEALKRFSPEKEPSHSPPRRSKQRRPNVRVPTPGICRACAARIPSIDTAYADRQAEHKVTDNGDSGLRRSSRQEENLSCSSRGEGGELRRVKDEGYDWLEAPQRKRRKGNAYGTGNIHENRRPMGPMKTEEKPALKRSVNDSNKVSDGFIDPNKYKFEQKLQALESGRSVPAPKQFSMYDELPFPDPAMSCHDAPLVPLGNEGPQFKMPPTPLEEQLGSSQSIESAEFKIPTILSDYKDGVFVSKKDTTVRGCTGKEQNKHRSNSSADALSLAKEVLMDLVPTSSATSYSTPSVFEDMATRSDSSSLSSPPASPNANALQAKIILDSPDSSQNCSTEHCPLCKAAVDEDLLDELRHCRKMGVKRQAKFCRTHKQRSAEKEWSARNYPDIDWERLDTRLKSHHHDLEEILEGQKVSYYKEKAKDSIKTGRDRTMHQGLTSAGFDALTPGYYGSRGARIMMEDILAAFSSKIRRLSATEPVISSRGVSGYCQSVLVPELAVLLIREDMHVSEEAARQILVDSIGIGDLLNEEEEEEIKTLTFEHGVGMDEEM